MAQYDFIIIGAGSAGCVLANRLSAKPNHRVLLLEAGGADTSPYIHIPAGFAKTLSDPRVNWLYRTEADPGTNGRRHIWPRGKVLGGSSAINGMLYVRGQRQDYDLWRQLGNPGWGWDEVLPYFKKSEDQSRGANADHGTGGPLHVADSLEHSPLADALIEAGLQAGIEPDPDPNDGDQGGIGYTQLTIKKGLRVSAATAYLRPAAKRPNLHIETRAQVRRVLFKNTRAIGVEYNQDGQTLQALAGREVIVCGGAINSPQVLQLSGVGPVNILKEKGIDVVHAAPGVGENLQDHLVVAAQYRIQNGASLNELSRGLPLAKEISKWLFRRRGLLSQSPSQLDGYVKSNPDVATPDLQILMIPATVNGKKMAQEGKFELEREPGVTIGAIPLRPESRGTVHIKTSNPLDPPAIAPNYLDAAADHRVTVEGLKWVRRIADQAAFEPYREAETVPGPQVASDEDLLSYARQASSTLYHPVGTCKMGADAMSVVDETLKVHGTQHLRVVDASIMPRLISGNTNAPTIMIAEKAADMILDP